MNTFRKMDDLGRVVIPADIRERLNLLEGDRFQALEQDGDIIFRRSEIECMVCKEDAHVEKVGRAYMCSICREAVKSSLR